MVAALCFERARLGDAGRLARLDEGCFEKCWSAAQYRAELSSARTVVELGRVEGQDAGWLVQWIVADESQILRVASGERWRQKGIAAALLRRAICRAKAAECAQVLLEVGRRNVAARALYDRAGFRTVRERRGYYSEPADDALVMALGVSGWSAGVDTVASGSL